MVKNEDNGKVFKGTWDYKVKEPSGYYTQRDWNQTLVTNINAVSTKMWRDLGEAPTMLLVSPEVFQ